jgi:hypothetical protein
LISNAADLLYGWFGFSLTLRMATNGDEIVYACGFASQESAFTLFDTQKSVNVRTEATTNHFESRRFTLRMVRFFTNPADGYEWRRGLMMLASNARAESKHSGSQVP